MMVRKKKRPTAKLVPSERKQVKIENPPPQFQGGVLAWRFNAVDKGGPFAWSKLTCPKTYKKVLEKLISFEAMTESDMKAAGCHPIELTNVCSDAQKRLVEIGLDDLDSLYSFRISGKVRVLAVTRKHYIRILWYDPEHQVCPAPKKHT